MSKPLPSPQPLAHRLQCKVYYEDTDCGGVVYHANYLKFMERARTEMVGAHGSSVVKWVSQGFIFVVYRLEITYCSPARLGDELVVVSAAHSTSPFRVTFDQQIERLGHTEKPLVKAVVELVCIDSEGNLQSFPDIGW